MPRLKKIGVLWQRKAKNGRPFLSGFLDNGFHGEDIHRAIFRVHEKPSEKSPDFGMYLLPQSSRPQSADDDASVADTMEHDIPLP